jgi:hypothetical protein
MLRTGLQKVFFVLSESGREYVDPTRLADTVEKTILSAPPRNLVQKHQTPTQR